MLSGPVSVPSYLRSLVTDVQMKEGDVPSLFNKAQQTLNRVCFLFLISLESSFVLADFDDFCSFLRFEPRCFITRASIGLEMEVSHSSFSLKRRSGKKTCTKLFVSQKMKSSNTTPSSNEAKERYQPEGSGSESGSDGD